MGHNLGFDYSFLKQWAVNQKIPLELSACDTLRIARALLPGAQSKKLESLCEYFQIEREHFHRTLDDAGNGASERTAQGTDGSIWKERQYQLGDSYTQ